MTEQRRSMRKSHDLVRQIQSLALKAQRTAHEPKNFVGPPPSARHLEILAEISALTEQLGRITQDEARQVREPVAAITKEATIPLVAKLPRQAISIDQLASSSSDLSSLAGGAN